MGSCASVNKNTKETLVPSQNKKTLVHSPINEKKPLMNNEGLVVPDVEVKADKISVSTPPLRSFGSKEDSFFDTQPWLESDGEDDFCSVNGDFTPSLGNTPVHHNFSSGPKFKDTDLEDAPVVLPESSPTKRSSELLDKNLREHQDSEDQDDGANKDDDNSITGTSNASGAQSMNNAEKIPNGRRSPNETSAIRAKQRCLPWSRSNSSSRYSEEKKKKKMLNRGNSTG